MALRDSPVDRDVTESLSPFSKGMTSIRPGFLAFLILVLLALGLRLRPRVRLPLRFRCLFQEVVAVSCIPSCEQVVLDPDHLIQGSNEGCFEGKRHFIVVKDERNEHVLDQAQGSA